MEEEIIRQPSTSNPHVSANSSPAPTINPATYISVPTYDPILIRHPIFQYQEDILLSVLTKGAKSLISNSPDLTAINSQAKIWLNWLVRIVFNNVDIDSLKEEFQRLGLSFDTICGKFIGHDEIYFRCLDCDRFKDTTSSIYALLCSGCFDNSNHVGHRVLMVKKDSNCSATCDCGDHTAFDPAGFCKDHQPKEFCIKETLNKFPQNFLEKFQFIMKNAFYGCLSLFELAFAANDKIKEALMAYAQLTLDATLSFCHICANQINESFLIVFGELFKTSFYINYSYVWHYCEDITAEKGTKTVDPNNAHPCECKLAGVLLRLANVVEHDLQIKLHKVLVECAKEATFKVFIMKEFTKYLHYLYSQTYSNDDFDDNTNSRLLNMKAQLYGSEDLCVEALSSGYFQNFVGVMRKAIHNCHQANHEVYHIASDIRSALIYFLNDRSKTSSMILKNFSLISQVLEVLMNFQVKFFYEGQFNIGLHDHQVDYKCINRGLMIEKVISQVIEQGVRLISDFPEEEKLALLKKIAKEWLVCFDTTKMVLDEEFKRGSVSFHPALERVFTSMLRSYGEELSEDSIMRFFTEILPDVNVSNLSERVVKGALNSLGMVRFVHLVHNYKNGKIWQVYYFTNNLFFEMDVLTIQLMTTLMNPESIFETYINSFFAYNQDLQGFFNRPESLTADSERLKQKLLVLDDFLHFLIYVMNDETSRLNSKVCKDVNLASEEAELSSKCHGVIEKVLINLLLGHYWVDVPQLKETMKNVLIHHSDVDDILHKVAVFDEKNKKVRIKDEYEKEFDPYIFYRNPSLQSDVVQNVTSRAKKDSPTDLVSGKFYKELPCYLKSIQRKLFQSTLPSFLANFLYSLQDHYAILVRPVLKLILTNLQVVEESKNLPEYEPLMTKVKSNYMNQNFAKKLSDLMNNTDLKDCKPCIEKIVKMVENLSCAQTASDFVNELKATNAHEDQMAMKKKLAHQRMQQLKEEFLKKQKMFSNKNALQGHEENASEGEVKKGEMLEEQVENNESELTCQFCLDKINKSVDGYGFPVYVSFTNNLYNVEETNVKFEKDEHPESLGRNWWPSISSCMHHYHEKCFKSHLKNSRSDKEGMDKLFANEFETYCSLCNTLCNAFVLEEAGKSTKVPDQEGQTDAIQEENDQEKSQEGLPLVDTIEKLLLKLKEKLKIDQQAPNQDETLVQIQLEEVFRKAYSYFLETFHVAEKSTTLERTFTMYQSFIKEYLLYLKKNGYRPAEVKSLLSRIFYNEDFNHLDNNVEEKIIHFCNFTSEPLLNDISFECLVRLSTRNGDDIEELDAVNEHLKILREYIAFKTIQIVLYCKEEDPLKFRELYQLYKEDEELREDLVDELLFPLQKFVLASSLNRTIMYNGCQQANRELLEALLEEPVDNIPKYLDKLVKLAGFGDSFDKIIEESLDECNLKSQIILNSVNEILTHNTLNLVLSEPKSIELAPRMIQMPKNYLDFISIYLKKKCSCCGEFSKHMSSHICLICGDVICLAYCGNNPVKLGNLNNHAKHYHLGTTAFVEIQKLSKSAVSVGKNSLYGGKDVYTDKLGQSIQALMNDPRCLLYSLDFDKFTLNEDFVKSAREMVENNTMAREIYKMTKTAGFYYTDGNL